MSIFRKIIICFMEVLFTGAILFCEDANEIIRKVDKIMYPNSKSKLHLITKQKEKVIEEYIMLSYSKDLNQKIIIRILFPESAIGSDLIFLEKNVWEYNKESARIIKVPSNQTFGGTGFSYGDVVRLNLTDNYSAEIKSQDETKWLLNLVAKERSAPYYRIELEVKKQDYIPVKGSFFGKNDQIIKTMSYSDIKIFNGIKKPTKITVVSPYQPEDINTLTTIYEVLKEYPDRIFNKNNLEMRQEENM